MATSAQVRDEILAGKWDETLGALYGGGAAEHCAAVSRRLPQG